MDHSSDPQNELRPITPSFRALENTRGVVRSKPAHEVHPWICSASAWYWRYSAAFSGRGTG